MNVVQSGECPILTSNERAFTVRYENVRTLIISSETHDSAMAFSEGALQSEYSRFKILKAGDPVGEGPTQLVLPFCKPTSGTLFFRSMNVADKSRVTVTQMGGLN